jgi:hypothetical protein
MATCPKCNKPCPDTAAHCGYCGAALPTAQQPKKTMFGYAAPTSQAARPAPQAAPREAPAPRPQPAPAPAPTPIVPKPIEPGPVRSGRTAGHAPAEAMAKTQYSASSSPLPAELVQQGMPAPASLRRSQPHPTQPPANEPVPATLYAPAQPAAQPSVPPTAFAPQAVPPTAFAPAASAIPATAFAPAASPGVPPTASRAAEPVPATVFAGAAAPAVVAATTAPRADVSRPVLASQTLADDLAPVEPGKGAMRVLMTIGGLLLVGIFCAPWGEAAGSLVFSWDQLKHLGALEFVARIFLGAGGLVFLVAGLLPLPYLLRAITGALLGLVPIGVIVAQGQDWRLIVVLVGLVLLPAALFHRWRYRGSLLARILVGVGVAALLATFLVPAGGGVPLIQSFEGLGDASASVIVARLYPLLLFLLSLLSLLAFLGSGSTGLAQLWAVLLILFLPLQGLLTVALGAGSASAFAILPKLYAAVTLLVCLTLSTLGLSHLMAKGSRPA